MPQKKSAAQPDSPADSPSDSSTNAKPEAKPDTKPDAASNLPSRVIKKYPNRRLYDTHTSTYITLAEIKQLVMQHEVFAVVDAKTSENLTRSILLQIILEEEANGSPMFTAPVLSNIIRFYGHAMQGLMGGYIEKNMQTLMDLQMPLVPNVLGTNVFQQMQEQMQKQAEQFLGTFGIKR